MNESQIIEDKPSLQQESPSNLFITKIAELEENIINAKAKLRSDLKNSRIFLLLSVVPTVFIVLHYINILELETWILVLVWILACLFIFAYIGTDIEKTKVQIERIEAIKRIYLGFPDTQDNKPEYFDSLVKINVENLAAYYSLVKTHTNQSFKVSLIISVIGFILIAIGLVIGYNSDKYIIGYIASGSGVLIEFISGALFYLYNRTVRQLKEYHDSLIGVQNILLSFKLIESTIDNKSKTDMMTKMIEFLVQKK